ncbi:AlpA family transcriptional regulator [Rathayibacter sp. AY1C5]|uniref:helix-turn-helix transcriptional regulator n=1 Tax=Rathayibacter sp. AY1C5 TaxID=2080538 RepID=UPI000CE7A228|nr:helix-turn-helix domain-containing protein [Rathayibacter sp. AY1C5]PPG61628.1 helix-turn-helix domain-containing protein [Rathayibacter sp. AY1C5]
MQGSRQHEASPLLTLPETAERLRKSEAQLRWMVHRGTAPKSALIGGRRMWRASDVASFIEAAFAEAV